MASDARAGSSPPSDPSTLVSATDINAEFDVKLGMK